MPAGCEHFGPAQWEWGRAPLHDALCVGGGGQAAYKQMFFRRLRNHQQVRSIIIATTLRASRPSMVQARPPGVAARVGDAGAGSTRVESMSGSLSVSSYMPGPAEAVHDGAASPVIRPLTAICFE